MLTNADKLLNDSRSKRTAMWFSAILLFRSTRSSIDQEDSLWEESIRLIEACSEVEATEKATQIGLTSNASFQTSGTTVEWVFDCVERTMPLDEIVFKDGAEVFSRFLRYSEVKSLRQPFDE